MGLALLIFLVLVIGLVATVTAVLGGRPAGRRASFIDYLCSALNPSFEGFDAERATSQTLRLLTAAMIGYTAVIVAWAMGAGIMRAVFLLQQHAKAAAGDPGTAMLAFAFLLPWQVLRAIGGVLTIAMAAGLLGVIIGFIFGIPSQGDAVGPVQTSQGAGGAAPTTGGNQPQGVNTWRLSSNLARISTWLTSAIIGVSLVEAKASLGSFFEVARTAAGWLFESRHGSPAVLAAVMAGSAVLGFLYAYLYAELIVSRLIVAVDRVMQPGLEAAATTLKNMAAITEALAPRISRSAHTPEVSDTLSPAEVEAALRYIGISFADISRPGVAADTIRSWARAKAVLNDYRAAAQGYVLLLGMKQT